MSRSIRLLVQRDGTSPFEQWYQKVADVRIRQAIFAKITRLVDPNYVGFKGVGAGVFELRIFIGPGYRVYFGMRGSELAIIIAGGDKKTQKEDIYEAKRLWKEYKNEAQRYSRKFHY